MKRIRWKGEKRQEKLEKERKPRRWKRNEKRRKKRTNAFPWKSLSSLLLNSHTEKSATVFYKFSTSFSLKFLNLFCLDASNLPNFIPEQLPATNAKRAIAEDYEEILKFYSGRPKDITAKKKLFFFNYSNILFKFLLSSYHSPLSPIFCLSDPSLSHLLSFPSPPTSLSILSFISPFLPSP